ncbi:MAG: hypothetical protein AAB641_02075 [Patescibacteria group bacterium]
MVKNEDTYQADGSKEISLRLNHYDDIFSDFDIRPYSRRALSSDFLDEIRRASYDKYNDGIELNLYVPETERDAPKEEVIADRLTTHFKKHFIILRKEKGKILLLGWFMICLGVASMILATRIIYKDPTNNIGLSFLLAFLEPAAWFLLWEGMDQVIFTSKELEPELSFYRKMANSHGRVRFNSSSLSS